MAREIPTVVSVDPKGGHHLTDQERENLQGLLHKYEDVFAYTPDQLGRTPEVKHIDVGDHPPIRLRPYRTNPQQK